MKEGTLFRTLCLLSVVVLAAPIVFGSVSAAKPEDRAKPTPTYNIFFGDLHTHTGYSDAYDDSTPWDAYAAAIDAGADFMAVTDHVQTWNAYDAYVMDEGQWADSLAAAESFTSKKFVAMAGYEAWMLADCGEVNVYNIEVLPPRDTLGYRYDRLTNFYDWLAQQTGAIGQFNHPLYVSDNFMDYTGISEARDVAMNIIEVHNEEYYEESYNMALDRGWHLMPSANSDTHYSDWIAGHQMRTVLLAESLTPEDLYAAMSACRGYATLDMNLEIEYSLNGAVMGSMLAEQPSLCDVVIHVLDPNGEGDEITKIEIISKGGVSVLEYDISDAPQSEVTWTTTISLASSSYYYVKVTTVSPLEDDVPGVTAWTAPIWTA
ncbi:MAG: CehA/McbA family metallohydrolase [Thermoplasmata archaeon]|nr:CehA/McbA family metallohydrolase [Thermoplasmata archaeon]